MADMAQAQPLGLDVFRRVFAAADLGALPDRVKEIVQREDRASEHLIGLVQLALAGVLCGLYLLAPRPIDAGMARLAPVPLALALYTSFSLLRLWLIMKRPLPGWFVAVSILADVGLVLGLIWSFHIEYGQPPGFALKAPTFVYLFVLVVLRALRFDPRYVLAAGLAGSAGWALLTLAAVAASPAGAVTRSFADYINGPRILIGAEFDKIFAMLVVTALLTLGALRAQRTLVAAVKDEAAVAEIRRFLSRGVADQISRSETLIEAGHAVEREAAILMLDIRGFTPFAMTVPPKDVVAMLTSLHARIIPIVRANGGVIDKFLGDGIMATFGAAQPSATAAADALRALDAVLDAALAWQKSLPERGVKVPLRVNAGVAAGPVVFATLGDGDRLEYTVIGEAVNLAAKLEKHNKVEKSRAALPAAMLALAIRQGYQPPSAFSQRLGARIAGAGEPLDIVVR